MTYRPVHSDGTNGHVARGANADLAPFSPLDLPARKHNLRRRLVAGVGASALVLAATVVPSVGRQSGRTASVAASEGASVSTPRPDPTPPAIPIRATVTSTATATDPGRPAPSPVPAKTIASAAKKASTVAAPPAPTHRPSRRATPPPSVTPVCRNSTDPTCGEFAWEPAPEPNQPLTITLVVTPEQPKAGEEVTVRVVATDPDAAVTTNGSSYFFSDPHDVGSQIAGPCRIVMMPERFGPWTPPERQPGRLEMSFTHTFSQPGHFEFSFVVSSGDEADPGNEALNPYASAQRASVGITVSPASASPDPT